MTHRSCTPWRRAAGVIAASAALSACFDPALAQTQPRSVQPAAQPAAPRAQALPGTAPAGVPAVGPGLPTAAGISPPSPFPAGLPSPLPFPAGTPSSVIAAPGTAADTRSVIQPGAAPVAARTAGVQQPTDSTGAAVPNTAVMGGVAGGGVGAATMGSPTAAAPQTPLQLVQTFNSADMNRDGALTRAEAQRIALPNSFEELDRNKDGVLSRGEYEDAF